MVRLACKKGEGGDSGPDHSRRGDRAKVRRKAGSAPISGEPERLVQIIRLGRQSRGSGENNGDATALGESRNLR